MATTETARLRADMRRTAERLELVVDREVYQKAGRDAREPIAWAGSLGARVCVLGRDLGGDEVRHGQPLVGRAGQAVRRGVLAAAGEAAREDDPLRERALARVLLTNLVPYKPPGNKAYPAPVREAFRPLLEQLLARHWRGEVVVTLGNEAYLWFERYAAEGACRALWEREDRYGCDLACDVGGRRLTICPLPHPSPANALWAARFPALLAARLERFVRS